MVTVVAARAATTTLAVPCAVPLVAVTGAVPAITPVTVTVAPAGVKLTNPFDPHATVALGIT